MAGNDGNFEAELRSLLAKGQKIEAIKLYRERTGAGLAAAKEAVEWLALGNPLRISLVVDSALEQEIASLLEQGQKIEAIKRYRAHTGAGLAEAKEAVEAVERGEGMPAKTTPDADLERELLPFLEQGKKIPAIKLYRERTGAGLKEAKGAVEALAARHHLPASSGAGCLGVVFVILVVILACLR